MDIENTLVCTRTHNIVSTRDQFFFAVVFVDAHFSIKMGGIKINVESKSGGKVSEEYRKKWDFIAIQSIDLTFFHSFFLLFFFCLVKCAFNDKQTRHIVQMNTKQKVCD